MFFGFFKKNDFKFPSSTPTPSPSSPLWNLPNIDVSSDPKITIKKVGGGFGIKLSNIFLGGVVLFIILFGIIFWFLWLTKTNLNQVYVIDKSLLNSEVKYPEAALSDLIKGYVVSNIVDDTGNITHFIVRFYKSDKKVSEPIAIPLNYMVFEKDGMITATFLDRRGNGEKVYERVLLDKNIKDPNDVINAGFFIVGDLCLDATSTETGIFVTTCNLSKKIEKI